MPDVYYSHSPFGTGNIMTGTPNISITSGVATISVAQTGNIGVGCRITYNTSNVCYISAVNSSTSFNVVTATGATPANTTSVVCNSIAHEYASLSAALAGFTDASHLNSTNLVTSTAIANIAAYYDHDDGTADTGTSTLAALTTSASYYVNIFTPQGGSESINDQRHDGTFNTGRWHYDDTLNWLVVSSDFTRVVGMAARITDIASAIRHGIELASAPDCRLEKNYLDGETISYAIAMSGSGSDSNLVIWNNLLKGWARCCATAGSAASNVQFENNTCVDGYAATSYGLYWSTSTPAGNYARNNFFYNLTDPYRGGAPPTFATNISDVSDATMSPTVTTQTTAQLFTNYAGEDYAPVSGADTIDAGTTIGAIVDDIINTARSGTYDVGAFEFASGGALQTVSPSAIVSAEVFGSHTITPGAVVILPTGIAGEEAFGGATVTIGTVIEVTTIPSGELFGSVVLTVGPVTIQPASILSQFVAGNTIVDNGEIIVVCEDAVIQGILCDIVFDMPKDVVS